MKVLKVADLLAVLLTAPKDALIVIPGGEHDYKTATAEVTTALHDGSDMSEDFGEDLTPESEHGKRINVVLIA